MSAFAIYVNNPIKYVITSVFIKSFGSTGKLSMRVDFGKKGV